MGRSKERRLLPLAIALAGVLAALGAAAQEEPPFVADRYLYGLRQDGDSLHYCVSKQDPDFEVARRVGEAIAGALLLQPVEYVVDVGEPVTELDDVYQTLLTHCDVHMGFKLLPEAYPGWMILSRSYYRAPYVLAVTDATWQSLADIPTDVKIGSTLGTAADLVLIQYIFSLPADARWQRFPMPSDTAAIGALEDGTVGAALVYAPGFWALQQAGQAAANIRLIPTSPLQQVTVDVGVAMLSEQSYLRNAIDQAIGSIVADGSLRAIYDELKFLVTAGP